MKRTVMIPTECDETTCYPCELRDVRRIGIVRHSPFCLAFQVRLARQKEVTTDAEGRRMRLTIRCRACLAAEQRAKEGGR